MPTSRRRVGFLPRPVVQEILDELSMEENLSQSKVVGILVEEALHYRGIFDKKKGKRFKPNPKESISSHSLMKGDITEPIEMLDDLRKDTPEEKIKFTPRKKPSENKDEMLEKFAQFLKFQEMMDNH